MEGASSSIDHVIPALKTNPHDVPMALLYKLGYDTEPGVLSLYLKDRIGVPDGHPLAAEVIDLNGKGDVEKLLQLALRKPFTDGAGEVFNGIEWKGFGAPSKDVTAIPILRAEKVYGKCQIAPIFYISP